MEAIAHIETVREKAEAFSVLERLLLLNSILPERGNITTLRLVQRFREELSFSEEEHAALKFQEEPGQPLRWAKKAESPKEIEFGPKIRELIATGLMAASETDQLTSQHLALCDRFLAEEEEGDPYSQDARLKEEERIREGLA